MLIRVLLGMWVLASVGSGQTNTTPQPGTGPAPSGTGPARRIVPSTPPGFLGVITASTAEGAVVLLVEPNSPAAIAKINVGDLILSVDGKPALPRIPLALLLAGRSSGSSVQIAIRRGGAVLTLNAVLAARPVASNRAVRFKPRRDDEDDFDDGEIAPQNWQFQTQPPGTGGLPGAMPGSAGGFVQQPGTFPVQPRPMLGITVQNPDASMREKFKLGDVLGVLVTEVRANTPAAAAGVEVGDMLQWIDDKPTTESAAVQTIIGQARPDSAMKLKVWRKGAIKEIGVKVKLLSPAAVAPTPLVGGSIEDLQRQVLELTKRVDAVEKQLQSGGLKSVPNQPSNPPTGVKSRVMQDGTPLPP